MCYIKIENESEAIKSLVKAANINSNYYKD